MKIKKYIEIRPGAGGEESENLVEELFKVYLRYCAKNNIKVEQNESNGRTTSFIVEGDEKLVKAFNNESGVHRFQRVPKTEKRGRVHTSTITVAVLDVSESITGKKFYEDKDIRIDKFHCGGKGGQNVNKVETGIRVVHNSSGIVVVATTERTQFANKANALAILNAKLKQLEEEKRVGKIANKRAKQVGTGNRNESRRTYNEQRGEINDTVLGVKKRYKDFFKGNLFE
jgi:peptide chain release factor 1